MTAMSRLPNNFTALAACLALLAPLTTHAQTLSYGDADSAQSADEGDGDSPSRPRGKGRLTVTPYIEAAQVAQIELGTGNDSLTYSVLAAGVDAAINGRNNQGSVSLRYERRIAWDKNGQDGDTISGVARISSGVVPGMINIEAGALAARSRVEGNGASSIGGLDVGDAVTQIYSVYAGPTLTTRVGDVAVTGGYRLGYTRVESPDAIITAPGQPAVDVFDDSVVHNANIRAATRAGELLPVGLGVGANYNREDISNLDQRVEDFSARADVTVPVTSDIALVGGVGYEKVQVSSRDALRDPVSGLAVVGTDGRYVTDKAGPRRMAYDTSGFIWDAGVIWRPSRRTAFEAHVGRRYGSTTYSGSFAYAPDARSSLNISVYDGISGFGGQVNKALAGLPTEFEVNRNPLTGDINGCVVAQADGSCLAGALGSVRSSVFRSRGIMASYGVTFGRFGAGIGGGYDRRKFIGAQGTILASANGVIDENTWLSAYFNGKIDRNSRFSTNVYANWYQSGEALAGDVQGVGATAAYYRTIGGHLTATAAVGVDGVSRELADDYWSASALVGVRYSF